MLIGGRVITSSEEAYEWGTSLTWVSPVGGDIHGQRYTGPPLLYGGAAAPLYPHTICFGEGDFSGFLLRFSCVFYPPMRFLYSILKL
jgi:hypothetical protein